MAIKFDGKAAGKPPQAATEPSPAAGAPLPIKKINPSGKAVGAPEPEPALKPPIKKITVTPTQSAPENVSYGLSTGKKSPVKKIEASQLKDYLKSLAKQQDEGLLFAPSPFDMFQETPPPETVQMDLQKAKGEQVYEVKANLSGINLYHSIPYHHLNSVHNEDELKALCELFVTAMLEPLHQALMDKLVHQLLSSILEKP